MSKSGEAQRIAQQRLRLWLQMLKATRSVERELRENYDMTLPRFDVLAAFLASSEGLKMSHLSQLFGRFQRECDVHRE